MIVDAGVSNIALIAKALAGNNPAYMETDKKPYMADYADIDIT